MNKKRFGVFLSIFLIIFLVFFAPASPLSFLKIFEPTDVSADFGDFAGGADYGDIDFGGGDFDFGGGDFGGDIEGLFWLFGLFGGRYSPFAIVVIIGLYLLMKSRKKHTGSGSGRQQELPKVPGATPTTDLLPIQTLKERDPAFSEEDIKQRISNLYVQMQNCWTAKDITPLRGDFTDAQYAQYDRQLQQYRDQGQTSIVERIAILDVKLMGIKQDEKNDILVTNLATRITFYVINDKTGQIVRGNKNEEKFMNYEWTLIRPKDAKTIPQKADAAFNCPNCAAPMNINQSAQCPYCNSIVSKADYDWVISGIKGLSQRTQ